MLYIQKKFHFIFFRCLFCNSPYFFLSHLTNNFLLRKKYLYLPFFICIIHKNNQIPFFFNVSVLFFITLSNIIPGIETWLFFYSYRYFLSKTSCCTSMKIKRQEKKPSTYEQLFFCLIFLKRNMSAV